MSPGAVDEGSGEPGATEAVYADSGMMGTLLSLVCEHSGCPLEAEHVHEHLQLTVVFEPGVCDYCWRDAAGECHEEHIVGPQFLLVAPGVPHSCRWCREVEPVVIHVAAELRETLLSDGMAAFVASSSVPGASHDIVVWQLATSLRQIRAESKTPDADLMHEVATSVARRALKVLSGALPLGTPGTPRLSEERVRIMDAYIEANIGNPIPIGDLARKIGLSVPHFTALCTATMRLSPKKYITRRRMLKALEMLKAGQHRVAEVARAVGIPDQGYFTTRFKEHFSFSPRSVLLNNRCEPAECPNKP